MNRLTIFHALLALYPREFRNQFSDEMLRVAQQKIDKYAGFRANIRFALICSEYLCLVKGATNMWIDTLHKLVQFRVGEYIRIRLERRALLVQKLVQFKVGEPTGQKHVLFPFPIIAGLFPRPTPEESACSTQELQQRHIAAQSATFQAFANHNFAPARKYESQAARFQSLLSSRNKVAKSD